MPETPRHRPPPAPEPRTLTLRQVTIVGVVTFGLFALLNASSLLRIVERQPFGWQRTVQVALVKPLDGLSHLLFLDRPRQSADDALGHEFGDASAFDDLADVVRHTGAARRHRAARADRRGAADHLGRG